VSGVCNACTVQTEIAVRCISLVSNIFDFSLTETALLHRTFSLEYSHHTVHDLRNEAMWLCKAESSSSGRSGVLSEKAEGQCWTGRFPCVAGLQSLTRRGLRGTEGKIGEVLGNFRQLGQVDSGGCVRESGATDMGGVTCMASS
jgi:hypothetical protein